MPAADAFVPLAVWLRRGAPAPHTEPAPAPQTEPEPAPEIEAAPPAADAPAELLELLRDVRLFRARLADALDAATASLAREIAYAVLGRELHIAPADLGVLVARIIAEHPGATPVAVRHAPEDALDAPVPAIADARLASGDLIVVFAEGTVDARVGVRLDVALEAWS